MTKHNPKVGFAFSTKDRVHFTRRSLASIDTDSGFDLIWVDGSDTPEGKALPQSVQLRNCRLVEVHHNVRGGPDNAIRFGLRRLLDLGYDYCGLIENDIEFKPGWYPKLMELFELGRRDGLKVGAATVRTVDGGTFIHRPQYAIMWFLGAGMLLFTREAAEIVLATYRSGMNPKRLSKFYANRFEVDLREVWDFWTERLGYGFDFGADAAYAMQLYEYGFASLGAIPCMAFNMDLDVETDWRTFYLNRSGNEPKANSREFCELVRKTSHDSIASKLERNIMYIRESMKSQIFWALCTNKNGKRVPLSCSVWRRRARVAWETVRGQPLISWPGLLMSLLWSVVRRLAGRLLRRLRRSLIVHPIILRAVLRGELRLVRARHKIARDTFEIELADDLRSVRTRCEYAGLVLEWVQSPAGSSFWDSDKLIELGVSSPHTFAIDFRGARLEYLPDSGVWPPTLDSYILAAALIDSWPNSDHRVWDVGCGTGIVGLHLLRLTACREALLTDVDPRAIEHAQQSAVQMGVSNLTLRVEPFPPQVRPDVTYDLLVSNPPYWPPGFLGLEAFGRQATDDLSLTQAILEAGPHYARRVVFGFSSIMLEDIMRHLQELGSSGIEWRMLVRRRLPLCVPGLRKPRALPGGVFTNGPNARFDLWHDLYVCELRHTRS